MYNRNIIGIIYSGGDRMEHKKTYNAKQLKTTMGTLIIEGPVTSDKLPGYEFHEDLIAFRPPLSSIKH